MDSLALSTLIAEIGSQMAEIDACSQRLESRALEMDTARQGTIEAVAYQVHNFYNATEDLLRLVAAAFENNVGDASAWHRGIVHQLSLDIGGVRPPLVSTELLPELDELRRFRHFFRHSYGGSLNAQRVNHVLGVARVAGPLLRRDVATFTVHLRQLRDSLGG